MRANVTIDGGAAAARLQRIALQVANPIPLYRSAGRAVANRLRRHFRELDGQRANQLGGKRQHFWAQILKATQGPDVDAEGATITIADPRFALRLYGGVVTTKNKPWLTIPVHPDAYGMSVAEFEQETGINLFRPKGRRVLMAPMSNGGAVPMYALCKSVTHVAEPGALPEATELEGLVLRAAEKHLARVTAEGAQA